MSEGELPEGWASAPLADLVAADGIFVDGDWVESKDQDPKGAVRLTQLADVGDGRWLDRSERFLTAESAEHLGCTYLQPDDVLIARMPDPLGRACLFPGDQKPCVTVVDVAVLRPGATSVSPRWLMHAVNSPQLRIRFEALQSGTTRKRVSRRNLAAVDVLIPPLAEQKRIADELERRLSHLDVAIAGLNSARRRINLVRESIIWSCVIPSESHEVSDGDLPSLPEGWEWSTLGKVADVAGGVTKDSKKQDDPSFVEVPYLRVANVQRGFLKLDEITTIRVAAYKAQALRLQSGDILFNEGGDRDKLGRGWVWEGQIADCIHQNHVFRARLTEKRLAPKFVSWVGNTFGRRWFENAGKQTTNLASINKTTLESFPVPMPPTGEVGQIVAEVERRLSLVDAAERIIEANLRKAEQLRRALLAAAFSGKLVAQDSNDEPAEELLARIREQREMEAAVKTPKKTTPRKTSAAKKKEPSK